MNNDGDNDGARSTGEGVKFGEVEAPGIDEFNAWRLKHGMRPVYVRHKKKIRSVSVSNGAYEGLRFLATKFQTVYGDEPSVSALLEAIGLFQLEIKAGVIETLIAESGIDGTDICVT